MGRNKNMVSSTNAGPKNAMPKRDCDLFLIIYSISARRISFALAFIHLASLQQAADKYNARCQIVSNKLTLLITL